MTTPQTPADWLPILAKRLDERHRKLKRLRRYAHGEPDLPEMGKNLRASWEAFQKKARVDYGGIAVRSLRNRIRPHGLRIGASDQHPALGAARQIERDSHLWVQVRDAIRDYIETGVGYLATSRDDAGRPVIRREKPETFIADPDPERPWKARAWLKVWRDDVAGLDFARVSVGDREQQFWRPSTTPHGSKVRGAASTDWQPMDEPDQFGDGGGEPGVAILDRGDDGPFLESHLDTIDRIVHGKLQRLVIVAMQAFRQRALKPKEGTGGLPAEDADGNIIDWAKTLEPAPGALWELPEGIDIWESQTAEVIPLLKGEETDARDFAAATGTPISVLIPDGQNQSAEGAANAKEQQIAQARDDIDRIRSVIAIAIVYALDQANIDLGGDTVEVLFAPPEHVSLSERYAAAVQAKAAGVSARTIKRDILGMTPDQIAQDEADAGADMLAAALMGVGKPATPQEVTDDGVDAGTA